MLQLTNTNDTRAKTTRRGAKSGKRRDKSVTHPAFKLLIAFNIVGAMVAAYLYFNREEEVNTEPAAQEQVLPDNDGRRMSRQANSLPSPPAESNVNLEPLTVDEPLQAEKRLQAKEPLQVQELPKTSPPVTTEQETPSSSVPKVKVKKDPPPGTKDISVNIVPEKQEAKKAPLQEPRKNSPPITHKTSSAIKETVAYYTVTGEQVYFHDQPDESTRRNAFINRWNKAVLKPLDEKNGFVYIVYTNPWGQTSKGWMLKKHLTQLD
jgi:hypothetical protein